MKNKFKNLPFYILSFLIPSVILGIIFYIKNITPFGSGSLIIGDLEWQFVPFVNEFCEKLKTGNSLMYSWYRGMGHDFIGEIAYYLASPLNLIFLFFNTKTLPTAITLLISIKSSLCGLTMFTYLNIHFKNSNNHISNKVIMVSFACCYALCSYFLSYYMLIMWFDCMYMLPLIILTLEALIKNKKSYFYSICLGYAIFTNYYIGYMVCFFVVLYFIYYIISEYKCTTENSLFSIFLRFVIYSIAGGGLAAIIWIPEIYTLANTVSGTTPSFNSILTSVFYSLSSYYCSLSATSSAYFCDAKIYCGVIMLVLIPLYFFNRNICLKKRITIILFMAFILLSIYVKPLEYIWNGFHSPIGYDGRNTFLLIFLLISVSYESILNIKSLHLKLYIYILILNIFFCALSFQLFKTLNMLDILFFNIAFIILYTLLIFTYKTSYTFVSSIIIAILIFVELFFNCYNTVCSYTSTKTYTNYVSDTCSIINKINSSDTYSRIKNDCKPFKNISSLCLYNSIPTVSSTSSDSINRMLSYLGQFSSLNATNDLGWEPVSASMLNIKYLILPSGDYTSDILSYKNISKNNSNYVYENNNCLSIAFAVNKNIANIRLADYNTPFDIINELGKLYNIDNIYDKLELTTSGGTIYIPANTDIYLYCKNELTDCIFNYNNTTSVVYPTSILDITVLEDLYNNNYIYHLPLLSRKGQISIDANCNISNILAFKLNTASFANLMELLSQEQLQVHNFDSTNISGTINIEQPKQIFTSIPYSTGWSVLVDGKKIKASKCFDALLSFPVSSGKHNIEFNYMTPGLITGCIISLLSLLLLYILYLMQKRGLFS